nr:Flp pilus assembly protein CpaB [Burkholderia ubonensis]
MPHFLKLAGLILVAVVGTFLFRALYVIASQPRPAAPLLQVRVRVAAADLPVGLLLRDADLDWKTMLRKDAPAGALIEGDVRGDKSQSAANDAHIVAADELTVDLLRHPVRTSEPLGPSDAILPSAPSFLAAALKPGMRAVSVAIDDVSGNVGLIQPGDCVDVLLTQKLAAADGAPTDPEHAVESETIAVRVRVLAVGSALRRPKDDAAQLNTCASTVMFEVNTHDAQVVTVGTHLDVLSLALRGFATSTRGDTVASCWNCRYRPCGPVTCRARCVPSHRPRRRRHIASARCSVSAVLVYRGSKKRAIAPASVRAHRRRSACR